MLRGDGSGQAVVYPVDQFVFHLIAFDAFERQGIGPSAIREWSVPAERLSTETGHLPLRRYIDFPRPASDSAIPGFAAKMLQGAAR